MSFVSKGEKKMSNMAKKGGKNTVRAPLNDSFGKMGQPKNSNMAPSSKDRASEPVSEDAMAETPGAERVVTSEYDPASGKRAKTTDDLRSALKKINERSLAGEASPTGKEGGQEGKSNSAKNATGYMKGGEGELDKKSMKKPRAQADQMKDEMEDPMDEDMEDNGLTEEGMTKKGDSRKGSKKVKSLRQMVKERLDDI